MANAGTATVKFVGDYSQLNSGLTSALAPANMKKIGMRAGLAVGGAFAAAGAAKIVADAVKVTQQFDKEMSSLKAVASATSKEMEALRKQAVKMGADTVFSATEAAQAQTELAKGGLSASQILGGALKSSLDLAAAGELDLAAAAETTVNSMQLFGLSGRATIKVADMLATAANRTTADVLDFSMALKQGGSVAKTAGYSLNDTVVILEALAEAGIKNSDAGTSMKAALIQLLNPTAKQAKLADQLNISWLKQNGELKNGIQISKTLRAATSDMTKAERTKTLAILAGTDGFRTLSSLYDAGVGKLRKYSRANQEQGTAAETARTKTDNLAGDVEQLSGAYETLQITIGTMVTPVLRDVTQVATVAVQAVDDALNSLNKKVPGIDQTWGGLADDVFEIGKAFAQFPVDPDGGVKRFLGAIAGDSNEVSRLQATMKARTEAASSLRRISGIVERARDRVSGATKDERLAEAELRQARKRFGDGSDEVLRAEIRLQRAKRRTIRLTREARLAERLQGVERKVVASRTRDQVVQEKSRIVVLNRSIRTLGRQWTEERRKNGNSKLSRELEQQIIDKLKERNNTQKRLNNVLVDASRQIGPKFAKSLQNISGKAATMEAALGRLPRPTNRVKSALGQLPPVLRKFSSSSGEELGAAQKDMERLQGASGLLRRIYNRNIGRSLPDATDTGMGRIQDLLRENMDAIQNTGNPQAKRRGGLVERVRQRFRKGGVPVAVSPGEMFKTPDGKAGIVPGRPEPRDSVLTSMPAGTKIFTWDGQAKLAAGKSEGEALRTQRPHFAGGGIVRPTITGGTERGAEVANAAVGKVHGLAKNRLERAKRLAARSRSGGSWNGGSGQYPGVSGDTDFLPALGEALSRMSRAAGQTISVQSGWRSYAEQAALYAAYLNGTGNLAAPPGSSNHESGRAADITPGSEVFGSMAGRFGLGFTVPGESWHIELLRRGGLVGAFRRMAAGGLVKNPWFDKKTKKGNINGIWPSADLTKDPNAWYALPTLPPYVFGALAEAAGRHFNIDVPGRAMMQMVMHEGGTPEGGKPGSRGTDKGGTVGYGPWAITTTFNDALVKRFGGSYEAMNNPVLNAAAMAHIVRDQGLGAWYGDKYVTDPNADWRGKYQLKNALGGIGYSAALRSALSGKFTGSGEGQSAADQRLSRRKAREKRVRELLQKAFGGDGARKGPLWSILDLYANFGDFGKGKNMSEAEYFLRKAGGIASIVNPNRGAGQLYQLVKWLQENVDMTGVEDGNDVLANKLERVRDKQGDKASTRRKKILSRISSRGLDYKNKDRLMGNDRVIRTAEEWIELAGRAATMESGPGGSEYTTDETAYERRLNKSLLDSLMDRRRLLAAAIKDVTLKRKGFKEKYDLASKKDSPLRWKRSAFRTGMNNAKTSLVSLRSNMEELVGLTGRGGRIGEVKAVLADLGVTGTVESARSDQMLDLMRGQLALSQQNAAILAAQAPIYQQYLPKYHTGGVVGGVGEQPIMARGGEGVFTADQMRAMGGPSQVTVVIEDGAVDSDRIRVEVDGVLAQKVSKVRRSVRSFG